MDWFLYDNGLRLERVKLSFISFLASITLTKELDSKNKKSIIICNFPTLISQGR